MKKALTILWLIIVIGAAFIVVHQFKLRSAPDHLTNLSSEEQDAINKNATVNINEPKTFQEFLTLADQQLNSGYYEKAIENYQQASKIQPNSSEALVKLGNAYLLHNENKNALQSFVQASKLNTESVFIKVQIARAYLNSREVEKARDVINQLDQNNLDVKYYKAIIAILFKDLDSAENLFKEIAATQTAENPLVQAEKSLIYLEAFDNFKSYREAEFIFKELLLAKAMADTQEYQAAIPLLFDVIKQKNNYCDAWIVLGFAYLNVGQPRDAIDALAQAEALTANKPETLFFLGLAYFANNDINTAIQYIERADKYGYEPKDELKLKLADLYLLRGENDKAASSYEDVLSLNKTNIELYVRSIWLNIDKLNQPEKALALALEAIENHPENAMSFNLVGWAYTALGDYTKAQENLKIALTMNPNFDAANLNFGWLYEKQGQTLLAKEYYKKAYLIGKGNSIGNLAAIRFNKLTDSERKKFYQVNISAP